MLGGWRPGEWGTRLDEMSTQRRIHNRDLRLMRPMRQMHPAHQAQSEILADVLDLFGEYLTWMEATFGDGRHTTTFYYRNGLNGVR